MKVSGLLLVDMFFQMIRWGVIGGAAIGAAYGVVMTLVIITDENPNASILFVLRGTIVAGLLGGAPVGIAYGSIAGFILGSLNGFVLSLFTWGSMLFTIQRTIYCLGLGVISVTLTFASGVIVFKLIAPSPSALLEYHIIPAFIAAIFFAYASQRAARWYLATISQ